MGKVILQFVYAFDGADWHVSMLFTNLSKHHARRWYTGPTLNVLTTSFDPNTQDNHLLSSDTDDKKKRPNQLIVSYNFTIT